MSLLECKLDELEERHRVHVSFEKRLLLSKLDALLNKWNRAVPLVGFKREEDRVDRYFIEALHASNWLGAPERGLVVDIGTGGGTPALPLAIQNPLSHWILLEPNRRKAVFLEEAAAIVTTGNVVVERRRIEDYVPRPDIGTLTMRGVAAESTIVKAAAKLLQPGGRVLLFTGRNKSVAFEQTHTHAWRICDNIRLAPRYETELLILERR